MNSQWFLPSLVGFFWMASPAIAGEVTSWEFDPAQNRLEFTTDEGVQPRAQLVPDPTRLVIDLPNTRMGEVQSSQQLSGGLRQIRLSQFDTNTTRIVVELAPGYLLDPQQVQFRGLTATDWVVQIPPAEYSGSSAIGQPAVPESTIAPASLSPVITSFPQRLPTVAPVGDTTSGVAAPIITMPPPRNAGTLPDRSSPSSSSPHLPTSSPSPVTSPPPTASDPSVTQIESLRTTTDGLFVQTSGAEADIEDIDRSRNRRSITITIANAVLSPQFTEFDSGVEEFGIKQLQFEPLQDDDEPPSVQITLTVDRDAPNWTASANNLGGIVLLPGEQRDRVARRSSATRDIDTASRERDSSRRSERRRRRERDAGSQPSESSSSESSPPSESGAAAEPGLPMATIEGIELDPSGSQLLIRSDRPVTYAGQWRSGIYQVQLSPARLATQVSGPQLESNSPLRRVRLREEEDDTVVVMIQPAAGVRFGALSAVTPQLLALEMERSASTVLAPPLPGRSNQPYPPPSTGLLSPSPNSGRVPNGQIVIVIDPGHGGADVGAVGIGDLYEADVVLPIAQQVGALLQQQGIYVVMTRNDDREIDLEPRVQMAEQANATLFVSIHANSMGMDRPDINGTETYYYSSGEGLAEVIQTHIVSRTGMTDRGIKQARFYVLRHTTMPAVLVELGYVTGSEDAPRLGNRNFQAQMAEAIAQGIVQYVRSLASQ